MMQGWLPSRGQPVPAPGAMHVHGATLMPGMLTAEEMAQLALATQLERDASTAAKPDSARLRSLAATIKGRASKLR